MNDRPFAARYLLAATTCVAFASGCAGATDDGPTGRIDVAVAPLSLPGVSDAVYTLTVTNGGGDTVWSKQLSSSSYGDGAGSISYVGTCDASDGVADNTIALVLDSLTVDGGTTLTAGVDFANPAPAGDPVELVRTCVADQDVAVDFEITVARAAQQGFFDVAITLSDVFCSAKLDCQSASGPLELLSNPATGERDQTAVLGFACTAGPGQETWLYMDPVTVTCTGGGGAVFVVDPAGALGNQNPAFSNANTELLFQAAIYRGDEQLPGYAKGYWNVALGLNGGAFTTLSPCTLTASASASSSAFADGETPDGVRWPYVDWDVPLTNGSGALVCTSHLVGGGQVEAAYTDTDGHRFHAIRHVGDPTVTLGEVAPVAFGASFRYADATYAASCDDYRNPTPPYVYVDTGSGVYAIDPDGDGGAAPYDVYCDMTTDGGGWTMLLNLDTSDGHVMWWDNPLWTDANVYGDVATPFDGDHKSEAYNSLGGGAEVMLTVHQQGAIVGWKAFAKSGAGTLLSYMTTGSDDVTLGSSVTASDTAAIWANEALVRSSTTLIANFCLEWPGSCIPYGGSSPDGNRLGSAEAQPANNVGGGLGNWSDMGLCCSGQSYPTVTCSGSSTFRTCSEAQAGWSSSYGTGNHGTFGTDSCFPMTNTRSDSSCSGANWAAANGVAYDYALFVR